MTSPEDLRRTVLRFVPSAGEPDALLLARFAHSRDEAAFAELVRRHGPMVLAACKRVTGHAQDAEDAFQAAFLVLARRAGTVRLQRSVGDWLFGVARRTALAARRATTRRRTHEARAVPAEPVVVDDGAELRAVLDDEVARLPERYRVVVVLADLEGKDRNRVAAELGIPEGTVASRLSRARAMLAGRLTRRGWGLTAYLAAIGPVAVPTEVGATTAGLVGGARAVRPETLAQGVITAMTRKKLMLTAAVLATVVAVGGGLTGLAAGPDGPTDAGKPRGYTVTATGAGAVLLDPNSGDTWVLSQPIGGDPVWVPVRKPTPAAEPGKNSPAKPKETTSTPPKPKGEPPASPPFAAAGCLSFARAVRVAPLAGVVTSTAKVGETVKAGDLLIGLDDTDAKLGLAAAEAGLMVAESKVPRNTPAGSVPELEIRKAHAEVQRARVEIARAKAALSATRLLAPMAGTVVEVNITQGETIFPGSGQAVVVASLRELDAVVNVAEGSIGRVAVGQRCVIAAGSSGAEFSGEVTQVSPTIDQKTATATVRVALRIPSDKPAPLAGMFVTVQFGDKK